MREDVLRQIMDGLGIINIKKSKDWLNGSCPFAPYSREHKGDFDSSPSFGAIINDEGLSHYSCFTCGNKGKIHTLIRVLGRHRKIKYKELHNLAINGDLDIHQPSWDEKRERLVTNNKSNVKSELKMENFDLMYPSVLNSPIGLNYLSVERGINEVAMKKIDIRYSQRESRVIFPVKTLDGTLVGFTGRTTLRPEEYPVYRSGSFPKVRDFSGLKKENNILGCDLWEKGKPVLIQEGLIGYAHLLSIGADEFFNIGTTMGALLSDAQANIIIGFGMATFLLYDDDNAGEKALFGRVENDRHIGGGAVDKLKGNVPVLIPAWMDDKKDPDELTIEDIKKIRFNTPIYREGG